MPSLDKRMTKLEDALIAHLTESGEIRQSIRMLAEAVNKISNRMWAAMGTMVLMLLSVVGFLLKVTLWK